MQVDTTYSPPALPGMGQLTLHGGWGDRLRLLLNLESDDQQGSNLGSPLLITTTDPPFWNHNARPVILYVLVRI